MPGLKKESKRGLHTLQEEEADPSTADDLYREAIDWLLEATCSEKRFPLVQSKCIVWVSQKSAQSEGSAVLLSVVCLTGNIVLTNRALHTDETRFRAGVVISLTMAAALVVWVFVIQKPFVEDAGRAYAVRLLAQCDLSQYTVFSKNQTEFKVIRSRKIRAGR